MMTMSTRGKPNLPSYPSQKARRQEFYPPPPLEPAPLHHVAQKQHEDRYRRHHHRGRGMSPAEQSTTNDHGKPITMIPSKIVTLPSSSSSSPSSFSSTSMAPRKEFTSRKSDLNQESLSTRHDSYRRHDRPTTKSKDSPPPPPPPPSSSSRSRRLSERERSPFRDDRPSTMTERYRETRILGSPERNSMESSEVSLSSRRLPPLNYHPPHDRARDRPSSRSGGKPPHRR